MFKCIPISNSRIFKFSGFIRVGPLTNSLHSRINRTRPRERYAPKWNFTFALAIIHTFVHHTHRTYWSRGTIVNAVEAGPRFPWRTYLSSLGRVTVKPPVDSTRLDSSTLWRIVLFCHAPFCLGTPEHPVTFSSRARSFIRAHTSTFILPVLDLFVYEPFDCPLVRSYVRSSIRPTMSIRPYDRRPAEFARIPYSFIARCIVLLFSSGNLSSLRFYFSSSSRLYARTDVRLIQILIRGFPENAVTPLRCYILTRE